MKLISALGPLSGSLGGITASHNKGGRYLRQRSTPTNPNSVRQQTTRNWMAYCSTYWGSGLDDAKRAQWVEWATTEQWTDVLGQSISLTGHMWFNMVNSRLLDAGDALRETPGDLSAPDGLLTLDVSIPSATTISCAFTAALPSGGHIVAWGSGPLTQGQDPNFRQCRLIGYSAADQATPAVFTLPYTLEDGDDLKVYVGVMAANGRVSVLLSDRSTWIVV